MAVPATLRIDIIADAKKATTAMGQVGDTAKTTGGQLSGMAGAIGGALAVGAVVSFGKEAVGAAEESASAMAGLETVFRNMGDASGTAAQDAADYASELSAMIGVEDELILAAQTQLASFAAVSDETARASGVFDRATTAAADLAAAGFGTLEGNAATLGKILQDPAEGLGKLQKLTGPLTDSQRELITGMAEAGDVAGAQAAVLDILEGKVGGTAEATATSSEKMAVSFGEVSEAVGGVLLPILEAIAPILQIIAGFLAENIDWLLPLAGAVVVLVGALKLWNMWQMILNGTLVLNPIGLVIAAIVALIAVVILVIKNWDNIVAATKAAWSAIKDAISVAIDAIAGFFSDLWGTITGLKDKVLGFFTSAVSWLVSAGKNIISGLLDGIKDGWNTVTDWVGGMLDRILGFYANAGRWLYDIGKKIIQGLWDGLKDMWSNVTGWIGGLGDKIADLKGPPAHDARLLVGAGKLIMGGLESGLRSGWTGVAGYLGSRNLAISGGTLAAGRGGIGGLGAPTTININVTTTGLGADAPELQRAVVNALRGYSSRNGPLDIPVRAVT